VISMEPNDPMQAFWNALRDDTPLRAGKFYEWRDNVEKALKIAMKQADEAAYRRGWNAALDVDSL